MIDEPKTYTTAIIAAVPSPGDPVHEVVAEDAHVTLQFLGEADSLGPEAVAEIQDTLEMLASVVYPFQVQISGTAELGPDKAQVLIVQSDLLTKIRETLTLSDAVSTAVANSEQFPNWIPHLTLAYEGEMPDVGSYQTVEIGSLELWLAEEHHAFRLDQKSAPMMAAAVKTFDESLHPRGADGRFIEKFSVIKYLTHLGWNYGKVEGIYADPGTGAVKLTVTPSDLSGHTHGESITLSPNQVYRAPKPKAHLTTSAVGVQKIGGQGGSNPGGLYVIPKSGSSIGQGGVVSATEQFYVKTPKTKMHGKNEALANALYEEAGVPVPEVDYHADGQLYSKIVKGQQDMAQQLNNPEWTDQVRRNFAVDAWLGNRDVFGLTYDNILTDENGVPWRIDNGGALLFRAMGAKKTDFGSEVTELDAFRQGKKAKIYGPGMSKAQELDGAERVLAISPSDIDELVADHGLPKSLADTLKARRIYIANYYGLPLPESKTPPEAEGETSAPLVDPPDIANSDGHSRNWFKTTLAQLSMFGQAGDTVELPDGSTQILGVDENMQPLSTVGEQAQLLGWQTQHGAAAGIYLKKQIDPSLPRPEHGSKLAGADLTGQRWKRGDELIDSDGQIWKIALWNEDTGALLATSGESQYLFDTKGKDANALFTVERWDPPAVDKPDPPLEVPATPVMTEQQAISALDDELTSFTMNPETGKYAQTETPSEPEIPAPVPGKTGQAAEAESAIKADLNQPLPSGNGAPAPAKTQAPGGAKEMVLGDGTKAATGDEVVSKKDGKTYKFVKPKGQYAVVTDPNGDDPEKQLLKLASTMAQPGKQPAADVSVEKPKTATGEVPALGMMALAKDGWAGEITMISPDGKFVFITDANGTRKRKSTGTVSITSLPQGIPEAPKSAPGPLKDYGAAPANVPAAKAVLGDIPLDLDDPADLDAGDMVIVGYTDGTIGMEPYSGQPMESLLTNTTGKVATSNTIVGYQGPVSAQQFVQAAAVKNNHYNWTVVYQGGIYVTNGKTGPNGGLVLWYPDSYQTDAFELPTEDQIVQITDSAPDVSSAEGVLPDFSTMPSAQANTVTGLTAPSPPPLYGDEAKTLAAWKGQISEGNQISLDGKNWMTVTKTWPSGMVTVKDTNGTEIDLSAASSSTFVIKIPDLKNASAETPWKPEIVPAIDITDNPAYGGTGKKKIGDLVPGDVVTDGEGETTVIQSVDKPDDGTGQVYVTSLGETWGSPADPNFEFEHHGNINEHPVDIAIGTVVDHLYPGATLQLSQDDVPAQVVSYPSVQANGTSKVALMMDGDPDNLKIATIGNPQLGADISDDAIIGVQLGSFTSMADAGVDADKLNAVWDAATVEKTDPAIDHKIGMTDQGIPFGSAQYPIYYGEQSGTYFRAAHGGLEEWDQESGSWNTVFGTVNDKEKVWDGVPFEGKLSVPESYPTGFMFEAGGSLLSYEPEPGETIQINKTASGTGEKTVMVSYPFGLDGPAHPIMSHPPDGKPVKSDTPLPATWKEDPAYFYDPLTIHDPFADPAASGEPPVNHQSGPQPPSDLGAKLQALGYQPSPGETFWVASKSSGPGVAVLLKQDDGTYQQISYNGVLKTKAWEPEDLKDPEKSAADQHYTWTYVPESSDAPAYVGNLPEGFAPYPASDGQSVLKVTLPNGKQNVYVQKQPGAGWYEMGPDGTVNENSDAVKSNHAVQMKLAGKGSQAAKYELLHPLPEGSKPAGHPVPTFENNSGPWVPDAHQSVVALTSSPGDTDPWFFVQDEPGGPWTASPNTTHSGVGQIDDAEMQAKLKIDNSAGTGYTLVYDGKSGQAAVDTTQKSLPSFHGYVPQPDDKVISWNGPSATYYYVQKPGEKNWHSIDQDTGELSTGWAIYASDVPENLGPEHGNDYKQEWPPPGAEDGGAPSFSGYTPQEGDKVISFNPSDSPKSYFVLQPGSSTYLPIKQDGTINPNGGVADYQLAGYDGIEEEWPKTTGTVSAPGKFGGYQTEPGDIVLQFTDASSQPIYVKKADTGEWHYVKADGTLSPDPYSQSTIDWALNEYQVSELQGTVKDATGPVDTPETATNSIYAGVEQATGLTDTSWHFGTFTPSAPQMQKLNKLGYLDKGQSAYALEYEHSAPGTPSASSAVVVRNSQGQWSQVTPDGKVTWDPAYTIANNDEAAEAYFKGTNFALHKLQFDAPKAAPTAFTAGPAIPPISGWEGKVPDPGTFTGHTDPMDANGLKAGDWIYIHSSGGTGMFMELAEDITDPGDFKVKGVVPTSNGQTADYLPMDSSGWTMMNNVGGFWTTGNGGVPFTPSASTAPSAPSPAAPNVPATPSYPGATKPSQEDINAWGGDLTKDGHIPTAGMYVTGKGPMSGKIVSVSKDKTKATVLTSDGKKTTRLISALKTDLSANYSAYAAPVTAKDIPQGMPLAVDTVKEALTKTAQDGKFRAILNGHHGISGGQMVVTRAKGPSGKVYNRVHMTLTPAQREQLVAMLAGSGEKGDWATSSKMSETVAIGDKLPMRLSSTKNPDGSPRWKVDPSQVPPTHEVTKVEPQESGILLVTMKDINTGEEITSRFHTGKSLTVYVWDPNKPKATPKGAFALSDVAKAQGWNLTTDGAISAVKGGATDGTLHVEPGKAVPKTSSAFHDAMGYSGGNALRNVSADGVVIEMYDPKGSNKNSTTGATVISVPEGLDETALGAALAKLGVDYHPMTQDDAKVAVRGTLRTLLSLDPNDVDTPKGWSDEKLFTEAGKVMGISDLGWQDVLVGVDETTGKTSFFWSDRARNALAGKASYNLVYRAASSGTASQIVSTVKFGSANSVLKRTTGMIDTPTGVGTGASWSSDQQNHAGNGSYSSASKVLKLPSKNPLATYKGTQMMVYSRPEAVLGRIADFRVASSDAFGMGQGHGANHLHHATAMSSIRDYYIGGGLPTEAVGFIAVQSAGEREKAIQQLKSEGFAVINGRPIEDIIITMSKAQTLKADDLPPVTLPSNARPLLDLPTSYDAPAGGPEGGPAATGPAVTAAAEEVAA